MRGRSPYSTLGPQIICSRLQSPRLVRLRETTRPHYCLQTVRPAAKWGPMAPHPSKQGAKRARMRESHRVEPPAQDVSVRPPANARHQPSINQWPLLWSCFRRQGKESRRSMTLNGRPHHLWTSPPTRFPAPLDGFCVSVSKRVKDRSVSRLGKRPHDNSKHSGSRRHHPSPRTRSTARRRGARRHDVCREKSGGGADAASSIHRSTRIMGGGRVA